MNKPERAILAEILDALISGKPLNIPTPTELTLPDDVRAELAAIRRRRLESEQRQKRGQAA